MRRPDSLKRRIVLAFLLFGIGASVLFAVVAAIAVEAIEVQVVEKRLDAAAAWAARRQTAGQDVDMPAGLRYYRNGSIAQQLRGLADGVHLVELGAAHVHVLAGHDARGSWVLVDHASDYDKINLLVYSMFASVFGGFLLLAALLGRFLATRVVTPIRALADSVGSARALPALTTRQDELGVLARALEQHTSALHAVLERERHFTGDVSHELRTPLAVIMGAAEILVAQADSPGVRAAAERIYRAARDAAECVTVLLLLARAPQAGAGPAVAVDAVAAEEVEKYRPLLQDKDVVIRFISGPVFSVPAPRELCAAAIGNLVRNACQYTLHGEVLVSLGPMQVVVEDSGPGLPDAVAATLGHSGADQWSGKGSAGTGLGLSLARRICDFLHAELAYQVRDGGGSRFTITFHATPTNRRP